MKFESLPNEILLDLFEYFNGTHLLRAFYGLNSRFNFLLYNQFQFYDFEFDWLSKRDFDLICQQHLPSIADRVIGLHLFDYEDTPQQINLFLSYIPSFKQFTHLQSLKLSNVHSYSVLLKLVGELQHPNSLTHLKLDTCVFPNNQDDYKLIINRIWNLPKLTNCHISIDFEQEEIFPIPTIISLSLECVYIFGSILELHQIKRLLDYTHHLKHLSASIKSSIDDDNTTFSLPTLTKLHFSFIDESFDLKISSFFQYVPNLRHLNVHTYSALIDGHQWELIIRNYLPKLKSFQLKMVKYCFLPQNIEEQADKLFNSFRSSFWIDEHKWFVQCFIKYDSICLSTLYDTVDSYEIKYDSWKSTCPRYNQQELYNKMTYIYDETFFDKPILSNIHLSNIDYLRIKLPINDQFWSVVPSLNKLKSLTVSFYIDAFQNQLQTLLDRSPHLNSLTIVQKESLPLQLSLFKHTNKTIRQLYLHEYNYCFNEEECITLSHSPLGIQCELLKICVNNCESISNLIKHMMNLQSLIVKCSNEEHHEQSVLTKNNEEAIQWLKEHLPLTYLIVHDPDDDDFISIWI